VRAGRGAVWMSEEREVLCGKTSRIVKLVSVAGSEKEGV
jgi:hypothetical protein